MGKAWVVFQGFNGTILTSKNIDSVVLVGSGVYRLNIKPGTFTDGNFAASGMASDQTKYMSYVSSTATTFTFQTNGFQYSNAFNMTILSGQDNSGPIRVVLFA